MDMNLFAARFVPMAATIVAVCIIMQAYRLLTVLKKRLFQRKNDIRRSLQ